MKIALLLCVAVQMLLAFPHHHHGNDRVCFDMFEEHVHADACTVVSHACDCDNGHGVDSRESQAHCHLEHLDVMQPQREEVSVGEIFPVEMHDVICDNHFAGHDIELHDTFISLERERLRPMVDNISVTYIVRALPSRAPSVLV